jgi:hypothetical protein
MDDYCVPSLVGTYFVDIMAMFCLIGLLGWALCLLVRALMPRR